MVHTSGTGTPLHTVGQPRITSVTLHDCGSCSKCSAPMYRPTLKSHTMQTASGMSLLMSMLAAWP